MKKIIAVSGVLILLYLCHCFLVSMAQSRGNQILDHARAFYQNRGEYPVHLKELRDAGFIIPKTTLLMSDYHYYLNEGVPEVQFEQDGLFRLCHRSIKDTEWNCKN